MRSTTKVETRDLIFVDDERFFAERYIEALTKDFQVTFYDEAGDALKAILTRESSFAMVLDIMMPSPSEATFEATNGGLDTGIWLLDQLRLQSCHWPFPVLILTNRDIGTVKGRLNELRLSEKHVDVRRKLETPAFAINSIMRELILRTDSESESTREA